MSTAFSKSTALKFGLGAVALAGALAASAAEGVRVGYSAAGASHYNDATKSVYGAEAGDDDFRVVLRGTKACDTAWYVASDKVAVPAGTAAYAFDFEIFSDADWLQVTPTEAWCCRLAWYGADGNRIKAETWVDTLGVRHESEKFGVIFKKGGYAAFRIVGKTPAGAAAVTIGFGTDTPNVGPGERVSVRNTRFTALPEGAPLPPPVSPDLTGPSLKATFVSPSADPSLEVRFTLVDQSEIDWASVRVTSVGTKAEIPFVREGNDIVLKPAGGSWAAGDHHVAVAAKDVLGNKAAFCKAFRIGGKPAVPEVTLRNYGVTSSKEAWSTTTNLTHRLSVLSPVLLAEDVPQPPAPVVLEGPAKDAFGRPAVTMLLKRKGTATYVLAVNACKAPVRARLSFGGAQGPAEVLWEDRAVEVKDGSVEDAFGPFAVHVYRLGN